MLKRVVRMFVHDSPFSGTRRMRDDRLSAVPVGKVIVNGKVWTGSLLPLIDAIAATFGPSLDTPLAAGRTLHANQLAGVIDLGRAWIGDLTSQIRAAARDASSAGPRVDLGPVLSEAERVDALLRGAAPTSGAIADGLVRLRRAADRVGAGRTSDATEKFGHITSASM